MTFRRTLCRAMAEQNFVTDPPPASPHQADVSGGPQHGYSISLFASSSFAGFACLDRQHNYNLIEVLPAPAVALGAGAACRAGCGAHSWCCSSSAGGRGPYPWRCDGRFVRVVPDKDGGEWNASSMRGTEHVGGSTLHRIRSSAWTLARGQDEMQVVYLHASANLR